MKNYVDLGRCYPPQPSASADDTSHHTLPYPIIAKYLQVIFVIRVTFSLDKYKQ